MVITFLGGTGRLGQALIARFSRAGFRTILGSRTHFNGQKIADELNQRINPRYDIESYHYSQAVEKADIIFMTIPFPDSRDIALSLTHLLQYKILVDTSVPILQAKLVHHSVVAKTQQLLGSNVQVVAAFQTIAAQLLSLNHSYVHSNVLVSGNIQTACQMVIEITYAIGLNSIYCGNIEHSLTTENLAITLMQINRHYHTSSAGVNILL